jgi:hypothetical protein
MERQRHGESVGFPWLAKDRAVLVARYARNSFGEKPGGLRFAGR